MKSHPKPAPFSGSKKEALAMLDLAIKKGVKPWIEVLPS